MEINLFMEGWEQSCCGEPFAVGSGVSWTGRWPATGLEWITPLLPVPIDAAAGWHANGGREDFFTSQVPARKVVREGLRASDAVLIGYLERSFLLVGGRFVGIFPESVGRWRAAAAVLAVAGAAGVAAGALRPIIAEATWAARSPILELTVADSVWARAAVWLTVGAVVLSRRRVPAVAAVWGGVVFEVVVARRGTGGDSLGSMVGSPRWWPVLVAVLPALLVSVSGPLGAAFDHLGRRGRGLLAATAVAVASTAALIPLFAEYSDAPDLPSAADGFDSGFYPAAVVSELVAWSTLGVTVGVVAVLTVMTALAVDPGVRPRAVVLLAAGTAVLVVVQLRYRETFGVLPGALLSRETQPVALVMAPAVVGGLGWWWVRRADGASRDDQAVIREPLG
ncbi:DUF6578 domain-containing protein [Actinoplanes sp. HUAS TT8]|uniref:DUF6578 domain-containing protein n=1 Tax=Actinoplanes sp. HUAS TT8 TaxID=3447453 RepID=UPI003F5241D4